MHVGQIFFPHRKSFTKYMKYKFLNLREYKQSNLHYYISGIKKINKIS